MASRAKATTTTNSETASTAAKAPTAEASSGTGSVTTTGTGEAVGTTRKGVMWVGESPTFPRLLCIPSNQVKPRRILFTALETAKTWGELKKALRRYPETYEDIRDRVFGDERTPTPDEPFDCEKIRGWDDYEYPIPIASEMYDWLRGINFAGVPFVPEDEGFGWEDEDDDEEDDEDDEDSFKSVDDFVVSNMLPQEWVQFSPKHAKKLIACLKAHGWRVRRVSDLRFWEAIERT